MQVVRRGLGTQRQAFLACAANDLQRGRSGEMNDMDARTGFAANLHEQLDRLLFGSRWSGGEIRRVPIRIVAGDSCQRLIDWSGELRVNEEWCGNRGELACRLMQLRRRHMRKLGHA